MSDDIEVRPAIADDLEQVWPMVNEFASSYRPQRFAYVRSFGDLLKRPDTLILVALNKSAIVGYLLGSYHGTFFANGPVAWIEELMVKEPFRRQSVATKLMSSAEAWARTIPTAYVALATRRAGEFYRGIGYEEGAIYFRKTFVPPQRPD